MFALYIFILSFLAFPVFSAELTLIVNAPNVPGQLPRNFRSCADAPADQEGLKTLRLSGSAQFSEEGLKAALAKIGMPGKVIVIDLRQECHGFLNGTAVSWFALRNWANEGKTPDQIKQEEAQKLSDLLKSKAVVVQHVLEKTHDGGIEMATRETMTARSALSEEQITKNNRANYFRLYITDHKPPSDAEVQRWMAFMKGLPADAWLHFHCAAGDGRTTTFMAMVDMMKNAKKVSFESILERQAALGGIDLLHKNHEGSWKRPLEIDRVNFLKKFYDLQK